MWSATVAVSLPTTASGWGGGHASGAHSAATHIRPVARLWPTRTLTLPPHTTCVNLDSRGHRYVNRSDVPEPTSRSEEAKRGWVGDGRAGTAPFASSSSVHSSELRALFAVLELGVASDYRKSTAAIVSEFRRRDRTMATVEHQHANMQRHERPTKTCLAKAEERRYRRGQRACRVR